jgi:hypothetical protein
MAAQNPRGSTLKSRRFEPFLGKEKAASGQIRVEGQVEFLGDFPPQSPWSERNEVHSGAVLKTATGRITVHLGPVWYFRDHDYPIKAGDQLAVVGIAVRQNQGFLLFAKEVRLNNRRLRLRDKQGIPFWARMGRQNKARRPA